MGGDWILHQITFFLPGNTKIVKSGSGSWKRSSSTNVSATSSCAVQPQVSC